MNFPTPHRPLLWALALAVGLSAATDIAAQTSPDLADKPSVGATINPGAAARRQREQEAAALKAAVRQAVLAVDDVIAACPGGPKPRAIHQGLDTNGIGHGQRLVGVGADPFMADNWACEPGWNHLQLSAGHALLAASSWAEKYPQHAPLLKISPASADELKRLQGGMANVLAAFGMPVKP